MCPLLSNFLSNANIGNFSPITKNKDAIVSYYVFVNAVIAQNWYLWFLMIKVLVWTFVIVVLYCFFTRFVLPIFKMTKVAGDHMRKMQQQMQDMQQQQSQPRPSSPAGGRHVDGDYIEYEEVK